MSGPGAAGADRSRTVGCSPASRSRGHSADVAFDRRTLLSRACMLAVTAAVSGCADGDRPTAPAPGTSVSAADVPVGGGTVFPDHRLVVTQPTEGTFRAFSAVCTHQGCTVGQVADGTINCACHGSRFDVTDGSVVRGPAKEPLPRVDIAVEANSITIA